MNGFPKNWPQNCPPEEAQDANGVYYRVGKNNPPATADFKSHVEMNKRSKGDECMRNGLSVFSKLQEARHLIRIFPIHCLSSIKYLLLALLNPGAEALNALRRPAKKKVIRVPYGN